MAKTRVEIQFATLVRKNYWFYGKNGNDINCRKFPLVLFCIRMFLLKNEPERRYCQKTAFERHLSNMAALAAKIGGSKVEIRKEHIEIYKMRPFLKLPENFPGKTTK